MTLSNQLGAASSSTSRKNSKKGAKGQKKSSNTLHPPHTKDDVKKTQNEKHKKWSGNKGTPVEESLLRRSFSIRRQISNLVNTGGSTLRRSLSFGKGLNENAPKKPWNASLQSLREDIPEVTVSKPESYRDDVFDSRKLVTRTQSLLVQGTRTNGDMYGGGSQVSFFFVLINYNISL
ncbi:hypothetical protein L9F63_016793 [Diploptera punctata]|uniref:Uncharacterized protein n=1 Tax=Diploptera punctata TaxID=6984 RepID=A0AAD8A1I4_DIPPU|nr:hypothetical protein L9F63_016793 [Diploptera punctata]